MSAEDLEKYETEMELTLYREYRDVVGIFKYVVETDRRFYLCNQVDVKARSESGDVFFEVSMTDAWVWDMYRPARFAKNVKVLTFKDVNVEELAPAGDRPAQGLIADRRSSTGRPPFRGPVHRPSARPPPPRRCRAVCWCLPTCPTGRHPRWLDPLPPHPSPPTPPPSAGGCSASVARPSRPATWRSRGLVLLDRNWRCEVGEIDLVLRDGQVLVICEVKTRTSTDYGAPLEAVDQAKADRLKRLAVRWLRAHDCHPEDVRIDMVGVLRHPGGPVEIEHVEGIG